MLLSLLVLKRLGKASISKILSIFPIFLGILKNLDGESAAPLPSNIMAQWNIVSMEILVYAFRRSPWGQ